MCVTAADFLIKNYYYYYFMHLFGVTLNFFVWSKCDNKNTTVASSPTWIYSAPGPTTLQHTEIDGLEFKSTVPELCIMPTSKSKLTVRRATMHHKIKLRKKN